MKLPVILRLTLLMTGAVEASLRYNTYFDQWHTARLPDKATTAGVTYVTIAFAESSIFNWGGQYVPFVPIDQVRALFDAGTKVCLAVGGWGDNAGFTTALSTEQTRQTFAKNLAAELDRLGYDCVDIDYEYPGGNGADWKQVPNQAREFEIKAFPMLLSQVKTAIGDKELSIAVPGRQVDMIAFTDEQTNKIDKVVDHVNVMTYDLMNRRMNQTCHHTSIVDSAVSIDTYIERGIDASKLSLGIAFYAKWFTTAQGIECTSPIGCPTEMLEAADGSDTGLSGAVTFETSNYQDGGGWGVPPSFSTAMANGMTDEQNGGAWFWDAESRLFWTWDTPALIARKFTEIVESRGLGGVFAWSLTEDSHDWSHFRAMQEGVRGKSPRQYR
ncbi:hypothetical protein NLU13_3608 [Sarocladium strictum]|uniref:chitinase n=1 Tax=Sarocladium strictum TaxID=5046 RepID=A0AA39LAK4_SARSR|nr:hypothetical protein NLU13_3608 [Sarocladium strictum]